MDFCSLAIPGEGLRGRRGAQGCWHVAWRGRGRAGAPGRRPIPTFRHFREKQMTARALWTSAPAPRPGSLAAAAASHPAFLRVRWSSFSCLGRNLSFPKKRKGNKYANSCLTDAESRCRAQRARDPPAAAAPTARGARASPRILCLRQKPFGIANFNMEISFQSFFFFFFPYFRRRFA